MVQNIEMLMQYDMQLYKKSFEENEVRIATFLCKYLNEKLDNRVYAFNLQENVLYAWSYYFANLADENSEQADNIMKSMIVHFNHMLQDVNESEFSNGDRDTDKPLYLDYKFAGVWFKTAICGMIMYSYGEEAVEPADKFLEENYYNKSTAAKTLILNDSIHEKK